MDGYETLTLEVAEGVATITLNRPERRNAVNAALAADLRAAVSACDRDPDVAVMILTGSGNTFCAGMDLAAFGAGEADAILRGEGRFGGFVSQPRKTPVIAAANGHAIAGGFELMLACDMVVASDSAMFGLTESKRGLVAGGGGVFRLAQRVPRVIANEMVVTGDLIDAARMYDLGLVNAVVPADQVMATALELATRVTTVAPMSVWLGMDMVRAAETSDEPTLWAMNDDYLTRTTESEDAAEGARAFLEKRAPKWTGR